MLGRLLGVLFFFSFQNNCPTCVRQNTVALVACNAVNALPLVEARVGGTFVDVGLAVWAWEQRKKNT